MNCAVCGTALSGGTDTYGDPHAPRCFACYFDPPDEVEPLLVGELRCAEAYLEELESEYNGLEAHEYDTRYARQLEQDIEGARVEVEALAYRRKRDIEHQAAENRQRMEAWARRVAT